MNEESIFAEAVQRAVPEREAFLDAACGDDAALRGRLEALLGAHDHPDPFLDALGPEVIPTTDRSDVGEQPGAVIGPYRLMEQIGEGGFGLVFVAEQTHPVRRKVALKVLKAGMDTRQVVARFEAERQALALMDHPNIARVFDGGHTGVGNRGSGVSQTGADSIQTPAACLLGPAPGRPYFVMELVKGAPITQFCDETRLTPRQRLELFVDLCAAVQHAHQKGVIHRDLKPGNVLITSHDGTPVVKVIDFGVAKAIGQPLTDKTIYTRLAQFVGTPLYMSPEQAGQSGLDVDTRSDIYSLGVMLYELLTGTTPFDQERFQTAGYDEVRRILLEEEPARPSTRISTLGKAATTVSANRQTDPKRLRQLCRGEPDWIVMKCLEKDRNRRYETASALVQDIERYLRDEPVQACPPSVSYRLRKFVRRNRFGLALTGLVLFFLMLLGSGAGWAWRDRAARAAEQEIRLQRAVDRAESLQREGKRGEALAALGSARLLAREAGPARHVAERIDALQEVLDDEARDEAFAARFDRIRLEVQTEVDVEHSAFRRVEAYPDLRAALDQYGLAIGAMPTAAAAAAVGKRPPAVQAIVIAALDECSDCVPADASDDRSWLVDVLQKADGDSWRNQVRRAKKDPAKLAALVKDVDVRGQMPSFLLSAASALPVGSPARLDLARRIQSAHSGDFWANTWLGNELLRAGAYGEAVRYYTAALALRPDNPGVLCSRGGALHSAGDVPAAKADLQRALALAPRLAPVHVNLGIVLLSEQRIDEAVARFKGSIELDPKHAFAYRGLAWADAAAGRWNQAATELDRTLERDADDPEAWREAAYAHVAAGDAAGYRRICRQTLERFGSTDDPVLAQRAAMTLSALPNAVPDFRPVERLAERAVAGTKGHEYYRYFALAKGLTEQRAGQPAEAVTWLARFAPKADGDFWDATAFATLAMAQHRLDRGDAAESSLARAKAIVTQKSPDPAKGPLFSPNWLDGVHARAVTREAEDLLRAKPSTQKPK
jgi:serine/threonine protein kinase/Tfp pilus assembly protein PilF